MGEVPVQLTSALLQYNFNICTVGVKISITVKCIHQIVFLTMLSIRYSLNVHFIVHVSGFYCTYVHDDFFFFSLEAISQPLPQRGGEEKGLTGGRWLVA